MGSREEKNREVSAGMIIYRRTKSGLKFLLLYHGNGHWNFPKGRLESGEKDIQAALREVGEETGIRQQYLSLDKSFKKTDKYFFKRGGKGVFKVVVFFLARAKSDKVKVSWEHDGYGWFLCQDAIKILKYQSSVNILEQAYKFLVSELKSKDVRKTQGN
ncbi:MAG: NUDIX hydrolase [Parcubacteria group bacterium Gr01-1014_107]|nr:MAG: NUDIX hydrolase [Parcubacteria group bacterium Gr01-1014_107]